jgi:hypothetical protein
MAIDESALTLSQKAFVNFNSLRGAGKSLFVIISAVILLNLLALIAWQNIELSSYANFIWATILVSLILCGYTIAWGVVKAPHAYKKLREWEEEYIDTAYVLIFNTTIPKGSSTGEKLLNLSKMVFPQLRADLFSSLLDKPTFSSFAKALFRKISKKEDESIDWSSSKMYNYKIGEVNLDVALKTDFGYFLIKDFEEKVVMVEDVEELVKKLRPNFKIFRILCVAKAYDDSLKGESLENYMTRFSELKVDLVLKEKVGYSLLWIS